MSSSESRGQSAIDAACLALMTVVSALPYVTRLGFYSDDWVVFADLHFRGYLGWIGDFAKRPVQGAYLGTLYSLFGPNPLGYHLTNTAVLAGSIPLLFWLFLRLNLDRRSAFASAAMFMLLPQLSTARVWFDAFQVPLALLFAIAAVHCEISYEESGKVRWIGLALLFGLLSVLAYEIFAVMILAYPAAQAFFTWRRSGRGRSSWRDYWPVLTLVGAVALLSIGKIAAGFGKAAILWHTYAGGLKRLVDPAYDWRTDFSLNIYAAAHIHFWSPIEGWGKAVGAALDGSLRWTSLAAGVVVASLMFWRLRQGGDQFRFGEVLRLASIGAISFVLGHAVFLATPAIMFSPSGIANRMLVAAAIGVAMLLVACVEFALKPVRRSRRGPVFAIVISLIGLFATWRIDQIDQFWTETPQAQYAVLSSAKRDLAGIANGSTVIFDGICPYHGPAILFEGWELPSALQLEIGRDLGADVVTSRMRVTGTGLLTTLYGEKYFYPFGPGLFFYDVPNHRITAVPNAIAARGYVTSPDRSKPNCPDSYPGQGQLI